MAILGVVVGVLIMLIAYGCSMLLYFYMRRRFSSSKYGVEVATLSIAILISIAVKFVIFYIVEGVGEEGNLTFLESMGNAFKAVYSGIGGLTFEGLNDLEANDFASRTVCALWKCFYAGSSLYAGLMVLSVLTAKISYEIYSAIRFACFKFFQKDNLTDFYVFTAVTEETLILAQSISERYKNNARRCFIMFTGPNLEAFDSKNELHREIMANGYYYWSYTLKSEDDGGVLAHLKIKFTQDFFKDCVKNEQDELRVHFFATDTNEKLSGLESVNSDIVLFEIQNLVKKLITFENEEIIINRMPVIDFYVLADNEINYEFYKREVSTFITNRLNGCDVKKLFDTCLNSGMTLNSWVKVEELKDDDKFALAVNFLAGYFQVDIISEAELAGKCLSIERAKVLLGDEIYKDERNKIKGITSSHVFVKNSEPDEQNVYRVMVLGFGTNGQQSMKHLYHSTAYVGENNVPSRFVADVYDPQSTSSAGLFGFKHPMFVCLDKGNDVTAVTQAEWLAESARFNNVFSDDRVSLYRENVITDIQNHYYNNYTKKQLKDEGYKKAGEEYIKGVPQKFVDVEKYINFPVIAFHKVSAFEDGFLKYLDGNVGGTSIKSLYKAFIITLGNDELNITMANALISDILCERSYADKVKIDKKANPEEKPSKNIANDNSFEWDGSTTTIYVNIRDKKNYDRINWTQLHAKISPSVKVVVYGASEEMFSFANVIDDTQAMVYDYLYNTVNESISGDLRRTILGYPVNVPKLINAIESKRKAENVDYRTTRIKWIQTNSFKKQSNYSANEFGTYYAETYKMLVAKGGAQTITNKDVMRLGATEHERWNRFHIANGWYFSPKRQDEIKQHGCICPFTMLAVSNITYDLTNSLKGMSDGANQLKQDLKETPQENNDQKN